MRLEEKHLAFLTKAGVEHRLTKGKQFPDTFLLEPPFKLQEALLFNTAEVGAFSYLVSGYFYHTNIGRYCSIARDVSIGPGEHPTDWLSTSPIQYDPNFRFVLGNRHPDKELLEGFRLRAETPSPHKSKYVTIGNDVLISTKVFIKRGVTIGDGAVIGAHAVVVKDIPPYAVAVGNPAKVVKYRFEPHVIKRLLEVRWWQYPIWQLSGLSFDNVEACLDEIESRREKEQLAPYTPEFIRRETLENC